jgi:hypothetical protein
VSGYQRVVGTSFTVNANSQASGSVACPTGKVVLGGGGFVSSAAVTTGINTSEPSSTTTWRVDVNNGTGAAISATPYAICANAS